MLKEMMLKHLPIGRRGLNRGMGEGAAGGALSGQILLSFFQRRLSANFQPSDNITGIDGAVMNGSVIKVRSLFLSDMHLGTKLCRADLILSFLKEYEAETLYLIGDIIDGWRLKKSWYWPELHEEVLRVIRNKAAHGTRVVYIPGNHDDFLRAAVGDKVGNKPAGIEIAETAIHTTADGRRFLVMHGDQLDEVIRSVPWLAHVGDVAYDALAVLNFAYNKITEFCGLEYLSISALAKSSVKRVVNFIGKFEEALVTTGCEHGVDGVICGHIHHAAIRKIGELRYVNTGDWVENCTAVVESAGGNLELIRHRATCHRTGGHWTSANIFNAEYGFKV